MNVLQLFFSATIFVKRNLVIPEHDDTFEVKSDYGALVLTRTQLEATSYPPTNTLRYIHHGDEVATDIIFEPNEKVTRADKIIWLQRNRLNERSDVIASYVNGEYIHECIRAEGKHQLTHKWSADTGLLLALSFTLREPDLHVRYDYDPATRILEYNYRESIDVLHPRKYQFLHHSLGSEIEDIFGLPINREISAIDKAQEIIDQSHLDEMRTLLLNAPKVFPPRPNTTYA